MEERGINPDAPSGMSTVLGSSTRGRNLDSTAMDTPNTPGLRLQLSQSTINSEGDPESSKQSKDESETGDPARRELGARRY